MYELNWKWLWSTWKIVRNLLDSSRKDIKSIRRSSFQNDRPQIFLHNLGIAQFSSENSQHFVFITELSKNGHQLVVGIRTDPELISHVNSQLEIGAGESRVIGIDVHPIHFAFKNTEKTRQNWRQIWRRFIPRDFLPEEFVDNNTYLFPLKNLVKSQEFDPKPGRAQAISRIISNTSQRNFSVTFRAQQTAYGDYWISVNLIGCCLCPWRIRRESCLHVHRNVYAWLH